LNIPLFMDFGYPHELKGEIPGAWGHPGGKKRRGLREAGKKGNGTGSRQVIMKEAEATAWVSGTAAEMV